MVRTFLLFLSESYLWIGLVLSSLHQTCNNRAAMDSKEDMVVDLEAEGLEEAVMVIAPLMSPCVKVPS